MVEDDDGRPKWIVFGSAFAPAATGWAADLEFDRCPCTDLAAPWVAQLLKLWRVADGRIEGLAAALGGPPSSVGIDLWDVLGCTMAALRAEQRRRAEARRKAKERLGER